jgi:gliding motility-associated lipoprotein GldH
MDEVILFNQKTGKPYGDGLGDIFDNRIAAPKLQKYQFSRPGKYKWTLGHNMRPDPLQGMMSIGAEVLGK